MGNLARPVRREGKGNPYGKHLLDPTLHKNCHALAHKVLTRDEMALWMKKKLNYILKTNIVYFQKHPEDTSDTTQMDEAKSAKRKIDKATKLHKTMERSRKASSKRANQMIREGRI